MKTLARLVPILLVALVACSDDDEDDAPGFAGRFEGTTHQGMAVVVELSVSDSGSLTGTSYLGESVAQITGTVDGDRASGTSTLGTVSSTFEATLSGDRIEWKVMTPLIGEFVFETTRTAEGERHAGGGNLDGRLVGRWRRTVGSSFNAGNRGVTTVTDIYAELRADGTYSYGGAVGAFTGTGRLGDVGGETGPGSTSTGAWKAEGGVLHTRPDGASNWTPLGQYELSGNAMGIRPVGGGEMQLWERQ